MVAAVFGLALPVQADIIADVTFSSGATFADFGFTEGGSVLPSSQINTATGRWNMNLTGAQSSSNAKSSLVGSFSTDVVSGWADIAFTGGSNNVDDREIVFTSSGASVSTGHCFSVSYAPGQIHGFKGGSGGYEFPYSFSVNNNDGQTHQYGWEWNRVDSTLKVFFDGRPVGTSVNVFGNWAAPDTLFLVGDLTGGTLSAHADTWDRWVIQSGNYPVVPEPSTLVLTTMGLFGLVCYAWRKRR